MGHKSAADRAAYFRDWKAGIRRTKVAEDGRRYIDGTMTAKMIEYDRSVRDRIRQRAQAKRDRQARYAELQEHYRKRIAELCERPFSWQQQGN